MYTSNQPVTVATGPVLRIVRRQRLPTGPAPTPQFEWYFCPQTGAFSHLVLMAGQQALGHWVLPALGSGAAEPAPGLWMQVTPNLGLARPVAHEAGCQGTALSRHDASTSPAAALSALAELVLHLPATDGLRQQYWLRPLRPGSTSWLLSRGRPHGRPY